MTSLDKYYTKLSIAKDICHTINQILDLSHFDLIIEPSAGSGVFIEAIQPYLNHTKIIAYDIKPDAGNIIEQDFLTVDIDIKNIEQNILILGNPPFGRQGSLAKAFIKKSCQIADSIAFILPKSFKKQSMYNAFDPYFHLDYQIDLPDNSFTVDNQTYNVPCIFQLWIKCQSPRKLLKPNLHVEGFEYIKKITNPEQCFSFRRVGVNAGIASKKLDVSPQSHYFIQTSKNLDLVINFLNSIKWTFNNTVGPKSISKPELNEKLQLI